MIWWKVCGLIVAAVVMACMAAACGGNGEGEKFDKVAVQLKWVTQAQFAGY